MLSHLTLENFKAFRQLNLPLRPLTLLAGKNGVGKSSVLQTFLLLRQSYLQLGNTSTLQLNGRYVELGNVSDVFYAGQQAVSGNTLLIQIEDSNLPMMTWEYERQANTDYLQMDENHDGLIYELPLFANNGSFQYLQAERVGPRVLSDMSEYDVDNLNLGKAGEYTTHFLARWGNEIKVNPALLHEDDPNAPNLIDQINAWMGEISPNMKIGVELRRDLSVAQLKVNGFRPTNVGFGITYTLPILVALLAAKPGDLLLLENPEAHLHARGQAEIGKLIAKVSGIGVQVIVETHSDHIFNGIRIGIREKSIAHNDVVFAFFDRTTNSTETVLDLPEVDENGKFLAPPPDYFFDEYRRAMRDLV